MFAYILALLQSVKADPKGVTALEYGLIAGAIAAVIMVAVGSVGTAINTQFVNIAAAI